MPISFLTQRHRVQRIGRVRLGTTKEYKKRDGTTGKMPVALPYFVVPDELKSLLGDQPTSLAIMFLANDLEAIFPHYLRNYTKSGLKCLGDGETILYRVPEEGPPDVRDGFLMDPKTKKRLFADEARTQFVQVPCLGMDCLAYQDGLCKATGYLRFILTAAPRLGYYDLVCHQRAVVGIKTQLQLALDTFGRLTGIPFILHRGEEEKVPVTVKGKTTDMPIRTQWVEVDPEWFQANVGRLDTVLDESARRRHLSGELARLQLSAFTGEESPESRAREKELTAAVVAFEEESFEGEREALVEDAEGEEPDFSEPAPVEGQGKPFDTAIMDATPPPVFAEPAKSAPPPAKTGKRPFTDPDILRIWIEELASSHDSGEPRSPSKAQLGLAINLLERAAKSQENRYLILDYLYGNKSATVMNSAQASACIDWLLGGKDDKGAYLLGAYAEAEAALLVQAALKAHGHGELDLEPKTEEATA